MFGGHYVLPPTAFLIILMRYRCRILLIRWEIAHRVIAELAQIFPASFLSLNVYLVSYI